MNRNSVLINWSAISCLALAMLVPSQLFAIQDDFTTFKTDLETVTSKLESDPLNDELYLELFKLVTPKPQTDDWLRRSIVNGASNPGVIHLLLGFRAIETGKVMDGITHWKIAQRQSPHSADWLCMMLKSVALTEVGEDYENKSDFFDLAVELYPQSSTPLFMKGLFLLDENNTVEAFEQFELATELAPRDTGLREKLIGIYTEQDQPEKASVHQAALDKILKEFRDAKMAEAKAIAERLAEANELSEEEQAEQAKRNEFKTRFAELATAVIEDPDNQEALTELAKFTSRDATDEYSPTDNGILETILDLEEPAAVSHIIYGIRMLDRGRKQEASRHFSVAAIHSEKAEAIIKNLLEIMSASDPAGESEKLNQ